MESPGVFVCVRELNKGLWENNYLFDEIIRSVRRTDRPSLKKHVCLIKPSWKIRVCSKNIIEPPGKNMSVRRTENCEKVAPGKKEQIF